MHRPLVIAFCLAISLAACTADAGSPAPDPTVVPGEEAVRLTSDDGIVITGRLAGSGRVGVVLAHMFPAEDGAASWGALPTRLADAGYTALAINFRGYVDSGGDRDIAELHRDVAAAHGFLVDRGATTVAYVGASMGGTAALVASVTTQPVAVVAVSAPAQFRGLDAEVVARELSMPVLLLAAEDDSAAATSLETLAELIPRAEAKLFGGDAHGTNLLRDAPSSVEEILTFLESQAAAA